MDWLFLFWGSIIGSIIIAGIGLVMYSIGLKKRRVPLISIGFFLFIVGAALLVYVRFPTDNYTQWKQTTEKIAILEIADEQYLIETESVYIYKTETSSYLELKKDVNTLVETTENTESDEAYMVIFTRYAKNAFNQELHFNDNMQSKYIFYIP